jgi:hypothetical protein
MTLVAACGGGTSSSASSSPTSTSSSAGGSSSTTSSAGTCSTATTGAGSSSGTEVSPAGDIPDNLGFHTYTSASGGYSIEVLDGWARTETADSVAFTDKLNTIRVMLKSTPTAPTLEGAKADAVPEIARASTCYEAGTVTSVTRPAGAFVLITYRADAAPDPVTGKVVHDDVERYETWKNGSEAILTLSGPQGSDNVDAWARVTKSFTWT